jgi:hypothetical protein
MPRRQVIIAAIAAGAILGGALAWFYHAEPDAPVTVVKRQPRQPKADKATFNAAAVPPERTQQAIAPAPTDARATDAVTPVSAPEELPNVVLILGCTVRKDQVTPYGGTASTTPFLQQLAERGTVFDDTIAAAPWTRAASTAILTGRHAVSVGMVEPGDNRNNRKMPEEVDLLAERMAARGYFTLGGTANPNLIAEFGFAQGHEVYQPGVDSSWKRKLSGTKLADALVDALVAQREAGDTRPFFLRAMMLDAHAPRTAKGTRLAKFRSDDEPERIAQYRYHLRQFDDALAHLHGRLGEAGFDQSNTVFMVIADHGEGMNYPGHHGFGHGQYHTSSTAHVPWLMAGPGVAAHHRILGVSSQVDLVPTLLGVIGAPLDDPNEVDGQDWSRLVRGEGWVTPIDHVWSNTWFGESKRSAVFTPTTQCQDDFGSSKRQQSKGKFVPGCYDRHDDALFTNPIDHEPLMASLRAWHNARVAELEGLDVQAVTIDADLNRQLEMLGYHE